MILDFDSQESNIITDQTYDVCIVGSGPAGIVTAVDLSRSGHMVALCEAGGMEYDDRSQSCYEGTIIGDEQDRLLPIDGSRLRFFGGTTGHWAGWCRPFTPIDFNRDYIGDGEYKWPIKLEELNTYTKKTSEILDIDPFFDDDVDPTVPFRKIDFQRSDTRSGEFRTKFVHEISESEGLHLYLNSNLVGIDGNLHKIQVAEFANYKKETFKIKAKKYVFAMGGIETPRIMLWFSQLYGDKFFSNKSPIGKYWMEHPHNRDIGVLVQTDFKSDYPLGTYNSYLISDKLQRENNIFGVNVIFRVYYRISERGDKNISSDFHTVAPNFTEKIMSESSSEYRNFNVTMVLEQEPSYNNAINLSSKQSDRFGIPRVELNWNLSSNDTKTFKIGVSNYVDYLMMENVGRIRLKDDFSKVPKGISEILTSEKRPLHEFDGVNYSDGPGHHIGALRMFENDKYGVVDGNCKVYGSENLYISGSSVFTTAGVANPTFPIIQLSLRLSDHLKQIL